MTTRLCPICRKAAPSAGYAPFCSRRCADVDLQHWFAGRYAVPALEEPAEPGVDAGDGLEPEGFA